MSTLLPAGPITTTVASVLLKPSGGLSKKSSGIGKGISITVPLGSSKVIESGYSASSGGLSPCSLRATCPD